MKTSWLFPCPTCKVYGAIGEDGHAICRKCEGYTK